MKYAYDYGTVLIEKTAAGLNKTADESQSCVDHYVSIMLKHDRKTQTDNGFQNLAALSAIETHLRT